MRSICHNKQLVRHRRSADQPTPSKHRLIEFDVLKGLAILLVVIGHIADTAASTSPIFRGVFIFIYSFHMPLFVFLAGLFDSPSKGRIVDRAIPYYAFYLILKICYVVFRWALGRPQYFTLFYEVDLPWFMLAMPAWMVLSYYTRHAHLVIIFPLALFLSVVAGYDQSIDDYLSLSRIIVFFPFYLLGFRLNADNLSSVLKRAKLIVIPCILILLLFAFCCYRYTDYLYQFRAAFVARFPYSEIPIDGYGATERLLYYALSFLLTACTISIFVQSRSPLLAWLGSRSLTIYCLHSFLVFTLGDLGFYQAILEYPCGAFIAVLSGIPIAILCASSPCVSAITWLKMQFEPHRQ